jgi:hypothetical protein
VTEHCACCLQRHGFGVRRLKAVRLLQLHPEFDQAAVRGRLTFRLFSNGTGARISFTWAADEEELLERDLGSMPAPASPIG